MAHWQCLLTLTKNNVTAVIWHKTPENTLHTGQINLGSRLSKRDLAQNQWQRPIEYSARGEAVPMDTIAKSLAI
jgi:hypothetical protein